MVVALALRAGGDHHLTLGQLVALNLQPTMPPIELRLISRPARRFTSAEQRLMRLAFDQLGEPGADS
jgi:hypothetical protein